MNYLAINCEKLPFGKTLGVSHFILELCARLKKEYKLIFVIDDNNDLSENEAGRRIKEMAHKIVVMKGPFCDFSAKDHILNGDHIVELLPHHFQPARFSIPSIIICHDFHVFDIPWKYPNVEAVRSDFRENILSASAVIAYFPRTYYRLEQIAGVSITNLFFTESPLLLDTRNGSNEKKAPGRKKKATPEYIYPAQLQEHKNHKTLIYALAKLKQSGCHIKIKCPGTTFNEKITTDLKELAKKEGVSDTIEFLGRLSNKSLCDLYWSCDGVIVPSSAEGGAYVALEAIAAGKPVAVSQIDSAQQHIKAVAGKVIWFDGTNVDSTVAAIMQLVDIDEGEWHKANAIARERINQMTWEKVAEKWFIILRWLSGKTEKPQVCVDCDGWNITVQSPGGL